MIILSPQKMYKFVPHYLVVVTNTKSRGIANDTVTIHCNIPIIINNYVNWAFTVTSSNINNLIDFLLAVFNMTILFVAQLL